MENLKIKGKDASIEGLSGNNITTNKVKKSIEELDVVISNKVDKAEGKNLSSNDFTSGYKARVGNAVSTGLLYGGILSINSDDNTKFDLSAGEGLIINNIANPNNPTILVVTWENTLGISTPLLTLGSTTYIAVDSDNHLVFSNDMFSPSQMRDYILIGWVDHPDKTQIQTAYTEPYFTADASVQFQSFLESFGAFNVDGNNFYPSGQNLRLKRTAGKTFDNGVNYQFNKKQPNIITSEYEDEISLQYYYQSADNVWVDDLYSVSVIDPDNYDTGNGLAEVPADKYTVQTIYYYAPTNSHDVQYGQRVYNTYEEAHSDLRNEINVNPYNASDTFRTWLIVKQGSTDLSNTNQAIFIQADKLGLVSTSLAGGATGEINTASNIGTEGVGVYDSKGGVDLQFRNLVSKTSIIEMSHNNTNKTIEFDINIVSTDIVNSLGFTPEDSSKKGANNGYAGLDSNGKLAQNVDASKITSGTIDIARLPKGALENLVHVANQTARFALTTNEVSKGDTVNQDDTDIMYYVIDTNNLNNENGYHPYTAGGATSVPWSGVTGKPTTVSGYGITNAYTKTEVDNSFATKEQGTKADNAVVANSAITGSTKTKITYDSKGLVTAGADATTSDIADSTDKRYCTDAQKTVIGNTSGTNTGDETTSTIKSKLGITTLSGSNTGDNAVNSLYSSLVSNATHTGDVTGSVALTITNKAVTLAKMNDMATGSVIYRKTAGTGVPEVNTIATLKTDMGLANVDNTSDVNKPISSATQTALNNKEASITAGNSTQYYRGDKTFQTLDKIAVGLSNVDNTSDLNKPVSTATTTALGLKINSSLIGASNGVCPLDSSAKIASTYLPSYVDDVLEYANLASLPSTGETGKIYTALDTNKIYRWGGSSYTEISGSAGSTDSLPEGSVNLYFTNARGSASAPVQSVAGKTGIVTLVKSDVGLGNVDNTSDANKPVSSATATALAGKEPVISTKNTAFNKNYEATPTNIKMNGTQAIGALDTIARGDHVHPSDTSKADATHVGSGGTSHAVATTSIAGFESAADKTKIDSVATGATKVESSTTNGNIKINGTETTVYTNPVKNNLSATVNPTTTDDSSENYVVGSMWVNTSTDSCFLCTDNTLNAATWIMLGAVSGIPTPQSFVSGCRLDWTSATAVAINTGVINLSGVTYDITSKISVGWTNVATGTSKAASTWYYVYLKAVSGVLTPYISTATPNQDAFGNSLTLATDAKAKYNSSWGRFIGSFKTDASQNIINFYVCGDYVQWVGLGYGYVLQSGTASTKTAVNCRTYVPLTSTIAKFYVEDGSGSGSKYVGDSTSWTVLFTNILGSFETSIGVTNNSVYYQTSGNKAISIGVHGYYEEI
jgi:hypothetical protein